MKETKAATILGKTNIILFYLSARQTVPLSRLDERVVQVEEDGGYCRIAAAAAALLRHFFFIYIQRNNYYILIKNFF